MIMRRQLATMATFWAVGSATAILLVGGDAARGGEPGYVLDYYDPARAYNGTTLFLEIHNSTNVRVIQVNMQGDIVWQYLIPTNLYGELGPGPDAELLTNGNVLFQLPRNGQFEITRAGDIVWSNIEANISHDADRLSDGHTLYVFGDNDTVFDATVKELNASNEVVWSWYATNEYSVYPYFPTTNVAREGWSHVNAATRLPNGDTLISPRNFNLTIIVNTNGQTVWSHDWSDTYPGDVLPDDLGYDPHDPEMHDDGTLMSCLQRNCPVQVSEINTNSRSVVWEYSREGLRTTRDADRLPNGNTLIVGVLTQMEHSVMFEVTPDSNIVWQLRLSARSASNSPGWFFKAQRVDDADQDGYQDSLDPDDDNDGMTDDDEIVAGTNPTNANEYFKIEDVRVSDVTNATVISWQSVTGRTYRVYTNYNLLVSWPTDHVYEASGSGGPLSYTNVHDGVYQRFFRLGVTLD